MAGGSHGGSSWSSDGAVCFQQFQMVWLHTLRWQLSALSARQATCLPECYRSDPVVGFLCLRECQPQRKAQTLSTLQERRKGICPKRERKGQRKQGTPKSREMERQDSCFVVCPGYSQSSSLSLSLLCPEKIRRQSNALEGSFWSHETTSIIYQPAEPRLEQQRARLSLASARVCGLGRGEPWEWGSPGSSPRPLKLYWAACATTLPLWLCRAPV